PFTAPANNPVIADSTATLMDATPNLVTKQVFSYDQYNNVTDTSVYDFGQSPNPGGLLRHTHTDYVTTNTINNVPYAYDTVNPSASSPSISAMIHIRRLPKVTTVDGGGSNLTKTQYEYDNYTAGLTDRPGSSGHDGIISTGYTTRGNPTNVVNGLPADV